MSALFYLYIKEKKEKIYHKQLLKQHSAEGF